MVFPSRHDAPAGTRTPACGTVHSGRKRNVRHRGAGDQQRLRAGWVSV